MRRGMEARVRNVVPFVSALVALGSARGAGQTVTYSFNAHTISLTLPPDYRFQGEASPTPGVKTIAFTTEPRPDGSRGLIQVSLVDLQQVGAAQRPTLEHFTHSIVDGVRQRRSQWKEAETLVEVGGVRARRVEWSGSNAPQLKRAPLGRRQFASPGQSLPGSSWSGASSTSVPLASDGMNPASSQSSIGRGIRPSLHSSAETSVADSTFSASVTP